MAGHHKISYDEGDVYEGQWSEDGKKQGLGVLKFSSGAKYRGQFVNGFFHGDGVLEFPDGSKYEGHFEVGKYHGYGVYSSAEGMKFEGQFQDGASRGLGLVTFADGSHGNPRCEGKFEGESCVQRCKASEATKRARQSATNARTLSQQLVSN